MWISVLSRERRRLSWKWIFAHLSVVLFVLRVSHGPQPDLLLVQHPLVLHLGLAQLLVLHFCDPVLGLRTRMRNFIWRPILPAARGRSWKTSLRSWCWPSSWPLRRRCRWRCRCPSASCSTLHQAPSLLPSHPVMERSDLAGSKLFTSHLHPGQPLSPQIRPRNETTWTSPDDIFVS